VVLATIMTETTNTGAESWNDRVIAQFRAGAPRIADMFDLESLVLLHTTGARSGQERVSPLAFLRIDGTQVIIASAAGQPKHPAWFHNLLKDPRATIEFWRDGEIVTRPVEAQVPEGAERDRLWQQVLAVAPAFGEYEKKTDRVIPVVVLTDRS
jgi:deazaflavin-dependent oxidoreductase (nitroreductase family)